MVQWLRPCASNAGGLGSILGQETRSHMLQLRPGAAKFKKKKRKIEIRWCVRAFDPNIINPCPTCMIFGQPHSFLVDFLFFFFFFKRVLLNGYRVPVWDDEQIL